MCDSIDVAEFIFIFGRPISSSPLFVGSCTTSLTSFVSVCVCVCVCACVLEHFVRGVMHYKSSGLGGWVGVSVCVCVLEHFVGGEIG
jgi:hypothetical protein